MQPRPKTCLVGVDQGRAEEGPTASQPADRKMSGRGNYPVIGFLRPDRAAAAGQNSQLTVRADLTCQLFLNGPQSWVEDPKLYRLLTAPQLDKLGRA